MEENRPGHQYVGENEIAEKDKGGELMGDGKKTQSDGFEGDLPAGMRKISSHRERGVYTRTTQTQQDIIPHGEEMAIHKVIHI